MTIIKKLEMKGFKSFANHTELLFDQGFNCVLGPNGSGKSNVLDALCFVLGKSGAKGLRAEKTGNLVFNGGKKKTPSKFAEVSIYFSNENNEFPIDSKEIKISRILKPDGQSKYKLNDANVTRTQILDVLASARINPDGYNIILQGQITHIIEMSSEQRRKMIEEIAEISVYEDKKRKAMNELDKVESRIKEAEVILAERETYIKELKKDRAQALKFKELDDKIKRNKLTLLTYKKNDSLKNLDDATQKLNKLSESKDKLKQEIEKIKIIIQEKNKEIEAINLEIEEKGEKDQVQIHKEVEKLKVDIALNKQRTETLKSELKKIEERKKELLLSKDELKHKIDSLNTQKKDKLNLIKIKKTELKNIEDAISKFRKKNSIDGVAEIDKEITVIESKADALQEELNKLREEQQSKMREKDRIEMMLQSIDSKIEKVLELSKQNKLEVEKLNKLRQEFKEATKKLSSELSLNSNLALQLNNARSKLLSKKEEESKLRARSSGIKESLASNSAVKFILENKKSFGKIYGIASELGSVKSKYALALEVAAGSRLKSIVVDTADTAAKCITTLKSKRLGVATFLPMDKIRAPLIKTELRELRSKGVHGLAYDLLNFDKKFSKIFAYIFGNTVVVEDILTAKKLMNKGIRMVTLTGDLVEVSGAMQGGHRIKQRGLGFQEKEVIESLNSIEKEIADLESVISALTLKKKDNEDIIQSLRLRKAELEGEIIKLEKSLHLDSEDLDADKQAKQKLIKENQELESKIDDIQEKISNKLRELTSIKIKKQELRNKISQLNNPTKIAELNTLEEKRNEYKTIIIGLEGEIKNIDSEIMNVLKPEQENIDKIIKQLSKEKNNFTAEDKELESLIHDQEKELKLKEKSEKEFYNKFKALFNKRSKLSDEVSKLESDVFEKITNIKVNETKINALTIEIARIKSEIAGLDVELEAFKGLEPYKDKSKQVIEKEIRQFEKMTQELGAVNMKAIEIYDTAQKEYKELLSKKNSLIKEKQDVLLLINELDSKKKEIFMVTYNIINKNFKKIFASLSKKGEASLYLEDEKDVFNKGLSIKVRITGKRFLDIRSLSGGEKTMTALAFLFAVQEHDPASFYIMDEVDAALDKRNSEKLADLIKSYSSKAQYIVISHNDSIIAAADSLFGISMNEFGISKVTTLKL